MTSSTRISSLLRQVGNAPRVSKSARQVTVAETAHLAFDQMVAISRRLAPSSVLLHVANSLLEDAPKKPNLRPIASAILRARQQKLSFLLRRGETMSSFDPPVNQILRLPSLRTIRNLAVPVSCSSITRVRWQGGRS